MLNVLVVTSDCQPIAFFDPSVILEGAREQPCIRGPQSSKIRNELEVVGRSWEVARVAQSTIAEVRARIAPVVTGLLAAARPAHAPLQRKS